MKPFFIIIDGPMGSGKTTVAQLLHKKLKKTAYVGIDRIKWFVSDFKRTQRDNDIARNVLVAMCDEYIKNGVNILLAQGFLNNHYRKPFLDLARRRGVRLFQYRLEAPREVLLNRLKNRPKPEFAKKPVTQSRILKNIRSHARHKYSGAVIIDTFDISPKAIAANIYKEVLGK